MKKMDKTHSKFTLDKKIKYVIDQPKISLDMHA